jgi:hypothetical protein
MRDNCVTDSRSLVSTEATSLRRRSLCTVMYIQLGHAMTKVTRGGLVGNSTGTAMPAEGAGAPAMPAEGAGARSNNRAFLFSEPTSGVCGLENIANTPL